jgi:hypothetical protein
LIGFSFEQATPYRYDKHHLVPFGEFIPPGARWFVDMMRIPLGDFGRGDVITCVTQEGKEIARGMSNYASTEARRIMRQPSSEIAAILGYVEESELIHRDNLVLL